MAYTYARRKELAAQRGFVDPTGKQNPYTFYRNATEYANDSTLFLQESGGQRAGIGEFTKTPYFIEEAKDFYLAFKQGDEDDYSIHMKNGKPVVVYEDGKPKGAKAKFLIEAGYVPSAAAWRRLYPSKTRFGHLVEAPKKKRTPKKRAAKRRGKK